MGRAHPYKGFDDLLDVLSVLARQHVQLPHLLLATVTPAQAAYARADGLVQAARTLLDSATASAWASARDGEVPTGRRAALRLGCCQMTEAAEAVCRILFDAAGSAAVHYGNGLEGCWRDAVTISRHALVAGRQLAGAYHLAGHPAEDL
jgi:indole-3-acetate monooxygenase